MKRKRPFKYSADWKHQPPPFTPIESCEHYWLEMTQEILFCQECNHCFNTETGHFYHIDPLAFPSLTKIFKWIKKKLSRKKLGDSRTKSGGS